MSRSSMTPSSPPEATNLPSGENATEWIGTSRAWWAHVRPVVMSHSVTFRSKAPNPTDLPSDGIATDRLLPVPCRSACFFPVATSHTDTSYPRQANLPSGKKATGEPPWSMNRSLREATSQTLTPAAQVDADTTVFPSGDQATDRIGQSWP